MKAGLMAALWLFKVAILCCFPKLPFHIQAMPPPNPIQCSNNSTSTSNICTIQNSYGVWGDRKECQIVENDIIFPTNEEELRLAVANATEKGLKLKVVTKFSHTIPKLACPPGNNNNTNSVLIVSTERYDSGINVDVENLSVGADAGVGLRAAIDKAAATGLSLVASPYWEGVSVGGVISTGAHGSSWWGKGGSMHDHVVSLRLIVPAKQSEGYAKVIELKGQDPLLRAAKVSLGVLGVISKVTFSLEKGFKRSVTFNFTNDDDFEVEFMDFAKKHEFADIQWYPSKHTAVYRNDDRVPIDTPGDGVNDFLGFQSTSVLVSKSVRAAEKALEKSKSVKGKCMLASSFVETKKITANGLKNNLIFLKYPVIGHQSKIQTSGSCLYSSSIRKDQSCPWDPRFKGLLFFESTAIIPASKFANFIRDIKTLRDLNPDNFCGVDMYNGFLFRFIKSSDAYLGQSEDSVVADFNYYRSDDPKTPRLNEDVWEEVEQIAFFKYGGKPHWGKNRKVAFSGVDKKFGDNFDKFVEAKNLLDPQKMFSTEWTDEILFGGNNNLEDGCALEGECICSEDRHCNPAEGYFCRPGLVYAQARVCRYSN